jgi:nitroreductase
MTADVKAWKKSPERYWQNAPRKSNDLLVNWMGPFHEGAEWLQRDEAQRSIGMAMQTIMLAAKAMGYESCPMIGFDHREGRKADQPARRPRAWADDRDRQGHQGSRRGPSRG